MPEIAFNQVTWGQLGKEIRYNSTNQMNICLKETKIFIISSKSKLIKSFFNQEIRILILLYKIF
jgi:GTP-sensing pleiotropic transcriptional regulator CodY